MWFAHGLSIDLIFSSLVMLLGFLSFSLGGYFTYQTYFKHPQFSYIPANQEWQSYLGELVDRAQSQSSMPGTPAAVLVDVGGAVVKPGVYQVSGDSRVQDALLMAGGFLDQANKQYIHHDLNLSRKIQDQEKIYIPLEGEQASQLESPDVNQSTSTSGDGKIRLGLATQKQLMELEGIGEKRASDILAGYPYSDEEDFLERSGLSRNLALELLQDKITLE